MNPRSSIRLLLAATLAALAAALGCAPKAPSTSPAATGGPASPTVMRSCPDPSDGPSIVVNAIEEAHRAFVANAATRLPPVCVLGGVFASAWRDSGLIDAHALTIAAELGRRGASERELLSSEIVLFARARRYAEVSRA